MKDLPIERPSRISQWLKMADAKPTNGPDGNLRYPLEYPSREHLCDALREAAQWMTQNPEPHWWAEHADRYKETIEELENEVAELKARAALPPPAPVPVAAGAATEAATGAALIAAERRRQVEKEGWLPEHDDEHTGGEIVRAAIAYAFAVATPNAMHKYDWWPWERQWFKPSLPGNPVPNLVKAGALIAAEIDRRIRAHTPHPATPATGAASATGEAGPNGAGR